MTGSLGELDKLLAAGQVDRVALTQQLDNIKEQLVGLRSKGGESLGEEVRVARVSQLAISLTCGKADKRGRTLDQLPCCTCFIIPMQS